MAGEKLSLKQMKIELATLPGTGLLPTLVAASCWLAPIWLVSELPIMQKTLAEKCQRCLLFSARLGLGEACGIVPEPARTSRGKQGAGGHAWGARKALSEHCISSRSRRVAFRGKESIVSGNLSSSVFDSSVMCPSSYHGCSRRVLLSALHGSIRSEPGSICSEVILTSAASPPGSAAELGQVWSLVLYFQRDSDTPGGRPAPHQHLDQKGSGAGSLQGHRQHLQQLHANDPPVALGKGLRTSSAVRGRRAAPTPSFLNDFLEKYRW